MLYKKYIKTKIVTFKNIQNFYMKALPSSTFTFNVHVQVWQC